MASVLRDPSGWSSWRRMFLIVLLCRVLESTAFVVLTPALKPSLGRRVLQLKKAPQLSLRESLRESLHTSSTLTVSTNCAFSFNNMRRQVVGWVEHLLQGTVSLRMTARSACIDSLPIFHRRHE